MEQTGGSCGGHEERRGGEGRRREVEGRGRGREERERERGREGNREDKGALYFVSQIARPRDAAQR